MMKYTEQFEPVGVQQYALGTIGDQSLAKSHGLDRKNAKERCEICINY
jgi:hypothetical protein